MIITFTSIVLAGLGLYLEYQRELKGYLIWRMCAVLLAIAALACLALPLTYTASNNSTVSRLILLTDGFNKDSLKLNSTDSIYTFDRAVQQQYPKAKLLYKIGQQTSNPLHVFGYGLSEAELDQLDSTRVIFHPSPLPNGIVSANWTDQLNTGEQFNISLKYKNTTGKALTILLKGLHTTLDSANVPANAESNITLQTRPKIIGKSMFNVLVMDGKDTLQNEELPVIIKPVKPLNVLMLSASPDFESRFLKTWLSDNGYSVASRSAISKAKFGQEFINIDKSDLSRLSVSLFDQFDLLIGDQSTLLSLSSSENGALQAASQKGMGIIVRGDSATKPNSWLMQNFAINQIPGKPAAPAVLRLQNSNNTGKVMVDAAHIIPKTNTQTLVSGPQGNVYAAATLHGAGKIVLSTINNTYSWQLSGNKTDYSKLWSLLIDKAARKETPTISWLIQGAPVTVNSPVNIVAESATAINDTRVNDEPFSPAQNPTLPYQYHFTYHPKSAGWQKITTDGAAPFWWYVWPKDSWQSLSAANRLSQTSAYAKAHKIDNTASQQLSDNSTLPVPKIYFFILFLMATTFLWAERKFINT